jgi:hypothetical protein
MHLGYYSLSVTFAMEYSRAIFKLLHASNLAYVSAGVAGRFAHIFLSRDTIGPTMPLM